MPHRKNRTPARVAYNLLVGEGFPHTTLRAEISHGQQTHRRHGEERAEDST
jgi:hypothetical protein